MHKQHRLTQDRLLQKGMTSSNRLQRGDPAPDVTVLDLHGQSRQLSESWRDGPVLLTFLRHFG
jgi:hypothetical protein